jgi:outer membrane protein assembly factor BamB
MRNGHSTEADLPLTWGGKDKENVLWKTALNDFGHSSPIVSGKLVFITGSGKRPGSDAKDKAMSELHYVTCYRVKDGEKVWRTAVEPGAVKSEYSRTAHTPVTDGKLVYAFFGSGTLVALDFDGKIVWRKTFGGPFKVEWMSSSPILYQDTLFAFFDANNDNWLLALDKKNGDIKWQRKRRQGGRDHNSSPILVLVKDKPQLVVASVGAVMGLDPCSDKVIWTCAWSGNRYPSVVYGSGLVYVAGDGGTALAIDPTGEGDVSKTHVKWQHKSPQGFGAPIIVDDLLYRASPPGMLRCWKLSTGELVYEERLEGIPTFASPVATKDGRIYFIYFGSACNSYVIKKGEKLEVLATNVLEEGERNEVSHSGASPAVAEGRIFLRGEKSLMCIGKK